MSYAVGYILRPVFFLACICLHFDKLTPLNVFIHYYQFLFAWMYRHLSLDYSDKWIFSGKFKLASFSVWRLTGFLNVYLRWTSKIMLQERVKYVYHVCVFRFDYDSKKKYNLGQLGARGFKVPELPAWFMCPAAAAAPTADCVDKCIKSSSQTTITDFLLISEHRHVFVSLRQPNSLRMSS